MERGPFFVDRGGFIYPPEPPVAITAWPDRSRYVPILLCAHPGAK
jgi:hypothetical protein